MTTSAIYRKCNYHSWIGSSRRFGTRFIQFLAELWKKLNWRDPLGTHALALNGEIVSDMLSCSARTGRRILRKAIDQGVLFWVGISEAGTRLYAAVHPDRWGRSNRVAHANGQICPPPSFRPNLTANLKFSETAHQPAVPREDSERCAVMPSRLFPEKAPSHQRDLPEADDETESIPDPVQAPCAPEPPAIEAPAPEEHPDSESFSRTHRRFFKEAMRSEHFPYEVRSEPRDREAERQKVVARLRALEERGTSQGDLVRVLEHVVDRAQSTSYSAELLATHKILLPKHFDRELEYIRKRQLLKKTTWEPSGAYAPPAREVLREQYQKEEDRAQEETERPGGLRALIGKTMKSILGGGSFSSGIR